MPRPKQDACKIRRRWKRKINLLLTVIRGTDKSASNKAALEFISTLTGYEQELYNAGWRITDETEARAGLLVEITEEWLAAEKLRQTKHKELIARVEAGDWSALHEF